MLELWEDTFVNEMGCECCCWTNVLQLNISHLLRLDLRFKSVNHHGRAVLIHAVIISQLISAASLSFSHIWAKSLRWETVHCCESSSSHSVIFNVYYLSAVCVSGLVKHYNLQILLRRFPPKTLSLSVIIIFWSLNLFKLNMRSWKDPFGLFSA